MCMRECIKILFVGLCDRVYVMRMWKCQIKEIDILDRVNKKKEYWHLIDLHVCVTKKKQKKSKFCLFVKNGLTREI